MIYEPGIYKNVSFNEYLAIKALSRSEKVKLLQSPSHYMHGEKKETPAMYFGSAYHLSALQPELLEKEYAVRPEGMDFRGAIGKAWKAQAEAAGKKIVTHEESDDMFYMSKRLWNHPTITPLLQNGEPELTIIWKHPDTEILCKARLDWVNMEKHIILDLKSCQDARLSKFANHAWDLKYHIQAADYQYGLYCVTKIEHPFYFIAQEKTAPYEPKLYRASQRFINKGQVEVARAIAIYQECLKSGKWPGYSEEEEELQPPAWVKDNPIIE